MQWSEGMIVASKVVIVESGSTVAVVGATTLEAPMRQEAVHLINGNTGRKGSSGEAKGSRYSR